MTAQTHDDHSHQNRQKRNHLAGLWAAELLGLIGHAAQDYAHGIAHKHGDDESLSKALAHDLHGRVSLSDIKAKLTHLWDAARHHR